MVWISWARQIHLLTERTRTSPESVLLCSQSRLFDTPKMLWTHWSCTHCFLQLSRHVHDHFSVVLEVLHLLLSFLNTSFPSCTEHPHMTSNPVVGILPKRPLMSFTVMVVRFLLFVLFAQLVIFIPTLILNLFWFSSCPCSGPRRVSAVDNVLVFSFARAHPWCWVCSFDLLHVFAHPLWVCSFLP